MNPNQPMLLTFELQPKQMTSLRIICIRNGIQLVKADPAMYGETIGVLCGMDEAKGIAAEGGLAEPMLLFANMTMAAVQKFLNEAKAAKFSRPSLMAMLTETNREWTPIQLQEQLARISRNFPAIPRINADGIYGERTAAAVRTFQDIFDLPPTGVTDYPTWYTISDIYVGVTRIAEPT